MTSPIADVESVVLSFTIDGENYWHTMDQESIEECYNDTKEGFAKENIPFDLELAIVNTIEFMAEDFKMLRVSSMAVDREPFEVWIWPRKVTHMEVNILRSVVSDEA